MLLLDSAGVKAGDPILYADERWDPMPVRLVRDSNQRRRVPFTRDWLPLKPFAYQVWALPPERKQLYMSRFAERSRLSGYLLIQTKILNQHGWLFDQLARTHVRTMVAENADYQLLWFEFKVGSTPPTRQPRAHMASNNKPWMAAVWARITTPDTRCSNTWR
jgi:hypothetical protein